MNLLLSCDSHPIIGHRGAPTELPENTLESFALALDSGAEALELDIRVTSDGVPVALHDSTLDRTTNAEGPIAVRRYDEIRALDAGAHFVGPSGDLSRGRGFKIPSLREILGAFPTTPLLIELKTADAAGPTCELIRQLGAVERTVIASFEKEALAAIPCPPFVTCASLRVVAAMLRDSLIGWKRSVPKIGSLSVPVRYKDLIPVPAAALVALSHLAGAPVHVWTVDDAETAHRLWDRGCNGMVTNEPRKLRRIRDQRFQSALDSKQKDTEKSI